MNIITINLSEPHIAALKTLQDLGLYPSRSEAIRVAIRDFLKRKFGFSDLAEKSDVKPSKNHLAEKKKEISRVLEKLQDEQRELGSIADY